MDYTEKGIAEFKKLNGALNEYISEEFHKWLTENDFYGKPASTKYHGARAGGLYDHSFEVMKTLVMLTEKMDIEWQNPRSPYIVGMFHDLCKVDDYIEEEDENGQKQWVYNKNRILTGHGDKSVILLSQFFTLTEEEIMCIRFHMGAYEKDAWDSYDKAIKKYETVLWTHTVDMYASKVKGM